MADLLAFDVLADTDIDPQPMSLSETSLTMLMSDSQNNITGIVASDVAIYEDVNAWAHGIAAPLPNPKKKGLLVSNRGQRRLTGGGYGKGANLLNEVQASTVQALVIDQAITPAMNLAAKTLGLELVQGEIAEPPSPYRLVSYSHYNDIIVNKQDCRIPTMTDTRYYNNEGCYQSNMIYFAENFQRLTLSKIQNATVYKAYLGEVLGLGTHEFVSNYFFVQGSAGETIIEFRAEVLK